MWSAGLLTHCWRECEMAQLFWKPAWQILQKLNIYIPYGPTTLWLDRQDRKWEHMSTTIFVAIVFVIAPNWKQPGCTSIGDWLNMEWWMTQLKTRIVNPRHTQMNVSYAEWKKADEIENRPCDFTSTKFGETQMIESDLTMRDGDGGGGEAVRENTGQKSKENLRNDGQFPWPWLLCLTTGSWVHNTQT